jgi:hypothetical protein
MANKNEWVGLTRALQYYWGRMTLSTAQAFDRVPLALNNEALAGINAANTALIDMIKVNTGNGVTLPSNTVLAAGKYLVNQGAVATVTTAGAATYTIAQCLGGIILRDPNGAARSDVLPSAALAVAGIPGCAIGTAVDVHIRNTADNPEVITLTAGAGGSMSGNAFIDQNQAKTVRIVFTNVTASTEAYVAYVIEPTRATRHIEITLTAAQVKALRATPITVMPAQGAGKVVEFVSGVAFLKYGGSNGFTESTANLALKYTDGSGVQISQTIESTGFIDQTASTQTSILNKLDAIVAKTGSDNKAVVIHNLGGGEIAGNAANDNTLKLDLTFFVHDAGW